MDFIRLAAPPLPGGEQADPAAILVKYFVENLYYKAFRRTKHTILVSRKIPPTI